MGIGCLVREQRGYEIMESAGSAEEDIGFNGGGTGRGLKIEHAGRRHCTTVSLPGRTEARTVESESSRAGWMSW